MHEDQQHRPAPQRPQHHHEGPGGEPDPLLAAALEFGRAASDAIGAAMSGDSVGFNEASQQTGGQ